MPSAVFGTAGHIDHGKSALVRALTGIDPDRLKEEKARGITIELGFAHFDAGDLTVALVDVPGHERFVRTMLAGASGIDFVLMVVAADESVMPQTREHFDVCRLLHVSGGVVALTKADLVDAETLELAALEARELVAGSFLGDAPVVPVSARTGLGVDALRQAMVRLALDRPRQAAERRAGAARLPIDRVFTVRGFGTVVTGTLVSGAIPEDAELVLLPPGRTVKVRGVQVHGQRQPVAVASQRTALNLGSIEVAEVARGQTLAEAGTLTATSRLDARLELLASARPLKHGARVRVHQGTAEVLGRVGLTGRPGAGPDDDAPAVLMPGGEAFVRLRLEAPAVMTRGDRYVLRAYSPPVTIGGGIVLDPQPPRAATRTAAARRRVARLDAGLADAGRALDALAVFVDERGAAGLPIRALSRRGAVPPAALDATVRALVDAGQAVGAGELLVSTRVVANLRERLVADLTAHHRRQPLSDGVPREELRGRLFSRAGPGVFELILEQLVGERQIVARERIALAGHQVSLTAEEERTRGRVERVLREAGLKPPDQAGLVAAVGSPSAVVERMVGLLVRQKVLIRLESLLFHAEALEALKADITELRASAPQPPTLDVGTFKDRYGLSRKYAIPLLEYLDRERITRRVGESRVVL